MRRLAVPMSADHAFERRSKAGARTPIGRPMNGTGTSRLTAFDA